MGWAIFIGAVVAAFYAALSLSDRRYKKSAGKLAERLRDCEDQLVEITRMLRKNLDVVKHNQEFSNLIEILIQLAQTTLCRIEAAKDQFRFPHSIPIRSVQIELGYIDEDVRHLRRTLFVVARALKNINVH